MNSLISLRTMVFCHFCSRMARPLAFPCLFCCPLFLECFFASRYTKVIVHLFSVFVLPSSTCSSLKWLHCSLGPSCFSSSLNILIKILSTVILVWIKRFMGLQLEVSLFLLCLGDIIACLHSLEYHWSFNMLLSSLFILLSKHLSGSSINM